jgi:hypothetical protein
MPIRLLATLVAQDTRLKMWLATSEPRSHEASRVELIGQNWNQILHELTEWQEFGRAVEKERSTTLITTQQD